MMLLALLRTSILRQLLKEILKKIYLTAFFIPIRNQLHEIIFPMLFMTKHTMNYTKSLTTQSRSTTLMASHLMTSEDHSVHLSRNTFEVKVQLRQGTTKVMLWSHMFHSKKQITSRRNQTRMTHLPWISWRTRLEKTTPSNLGMKMKILSTMRNTTRVVRMCSERSRLKIMVGNLETPW